VRGEIADIEQFLLLPQWFLMSFAKTCKISLLSGKGLSNYRFYEFVADDFRNDCWKIIIA